MQALLQPGYAMFCRFHTACRPSCLQGSFLVAESRALNAARLQEADHPCALGWPKLPALTLCLSSVTVLCVPSVAVAAGGC